VGAVEELLAAVRDGAQLDAGPVRRAARTLCGRRPEDEELPEDCAALADGHQGLAGDVLSPRRRLLVVGDAADRVVRSCGLRCVVREPNNRPPDEIHADDLVPRALLGRQQTDCDRPLGPRLVTFRLDQRRHRWVRTHLVGAKVGAEVGILPEQPHGFVELVPRRRRLLAGLGDQRASATVDRRIDDERLVLAVVEDRRPIRDRRRRREATASLSLLLLDGLDREQPMPRAAEALANRGVAEHPPRNLLELCGLRPGTNHLHLQRRLRRRDRGLGALDARFRLRSRPRSGHDASLSCTRGNRRSKASRRA
jgi:hypothetical protein